ncbi:sugar phosphate isomerase/epimerase family protein [Herbiconiux sp. A18JL235]|uniref:Sugar phosphate isomerase/epimerase family protein n=1 Tax=Herbiconiux sp. A18JL235 TaxID=3152363 RepID=A0AB39BI00_9MICO
MPEPELIASCWTTAGDAAPQRGDETSPFALLDRIRAAGAAGWSGFGLVHADLKTALTTLDYADIRGALDDAGLRYLELEFLGDWWTDGDRRVVSDAMRGELFEAARALSPLHIKCAGDFSGGVVDDELLVREFRKLAEEAADAGTRLALEALPMTNFSTIEAGQRFLSEVAHPAAGLCIDIWHVYRGGTPIDELTGFVDPATLFAVELNDARAAQPADLWIDTVDERMLPGEGEWDVAGFINVIRGLGFDGPWGVEILSAAHRSRRLDEALDAARSATLGEFARADEALRG